VIETAHGRSEVDASDADAVAALFGAQARSDAGCLDLVVDDCRRVRNWIDAGMRCVDLFATCVHAMQTTPSLRGLPRCRTRAGPRRTRATPRPQSPPGSAPLYAGARPVDDAGWLVAHRTIGR
jgi:hypothetical protein